METLTLRLRFHLEGFDLLVGLRQYGIETAGEVADYCLRSFWILSWRPSSFPDGPTRPRESLSADDLGREGSGTPNHGIGEERLMAMSSFHPFRQGGCSLRTRVWRDPANRGEISLQTSRDKNRRHVISGRKFGPVDTFGRGRRLAQKSIAGRSWQGQSWVHLDSDRPPLFGMLSPKSPTPRPVAGRGHCSRNRFFLVRSRFLTTVWRPLGNGLVNRRIRRFARYLMS